MGVRTAERMKTDCKGFLNGGPAPKAPHKTCLILAEELPAIHASFRIANEQMEKTKLAQITHKIAGYLLRLILSSL